MADGAYQQVEKFSLTIKTSAGAKTMELTYEELVDLHKVTAELIAKRDEARSWPFGEIEKRKGHLPARRADESS